MFGFEAMYGPQIQRLQVESNDHVMIFRDGRKWLRAWRSWYRHCHHATRFHRLSGVLGLLSYQIKASQTKPQIPYASEINQRPLFNLSIRGKSEITGTMSMVSHDEEKSKIPIVADAPIPLTILDEIKDCAQERLPGNDQVIASRLEINLPSWHRWLLLVIFCIARVCLEFHPMTGIPVLKDISSFLGP